MKKLLPFLFSFLILGFLLQAQRTITIGTGVEVANGPITGSQMSQMFVRNASIYKPSDGLVKGTILSLAWNRPSASYIPIPVKIYLQEIPRTDTGITSSWAWNTLTSSAVLVYDDVINNWNNTSPDWVQVPLQVPFFYNGAGNLRVMVSIDKAYYYGPINWAYTTTTGTNSYGYSEELTNNDNSNTSVTLSSNRPNIRLSIDTNRRCHVPGGIAFSNITRTSATINWSPRGAETNWILSYREKGRSAWIEESVGNNPTHILTSLLPNKSYEVTVKAICGVTDTGCASGIASFWTIFEAPIYEDFENILIPSCWSFIHDNSSPSIGINYSPFPFSYPYPYPNFNYFSPAYSYSPYNRCAMSASTTPFQNTALVSPRFSNPINTLRTRFMAMFSNGSGTLKIGYMADPNDTSTFHLQQVDSLTSNWKEYTVSFQSANATGNHIVFMHGGINADSYASYLDDVIIEPIPNCADINKDSVRITEITTTSAKITHPSINGVANYTIRYREKGQTTWTTNTNVSLPYTLINLTSGTQYEMSMHSNCGGIDTGVWCRSIEFWTAFDLPISQYFDSTSNIGGFSTLQSNNEITAFSTVHYSLAMYNGNCAPENKFYLISSKINPSLSMDTVQVRFKAKGTIPGLKLEVGVINPEDINSFIRVDTILMTTEWNTCIVSFANYTGNNFNIAFGHNGNTPLSSIYVDNVDIDYIPSSCQEVANIYARSIHSNSIDLNWRNLQTSYVVKYGIAGSGNMQTQNASTNSTTLSGLMENTTYEVKIRTNCAPEFWSESAQITTKPSPDTIPFIESFETSPVWQLLNGNAGNRWVIGTAAQNGGNKGLYISYDNGASNSYSAATSIVYAVKPLYFDEEYDYIIEYDWRCMGHYSATSVYNSYLRIALVPDTITITAGEELNLSNTIDLGKLYDSNNWLHKTVSFHISQPCMYNLVLYWYNNLIHGVPPAAIDNIYIYRKPCAVPVNMNIINITAHTADIAYSVTDSITSKIRFFYRPYHVINPGRWDSIEVFVTNGRLTDTLTLTGLQSGTTYEVMSKTICIYDESPLSETRKFTTQCSSLSVPWIEDFENIQGGNCYLPSTCWKERKLLYTPTSIMQTSNMQYRAEQWMCYTVGMIDMYNRNDWLITPAIDIGARGNYELQFDVKLSGSSYLYPPTIGANDKFIVLISLDGGNTWDPAHATEWSNSSSLHPLSSLNEQFQTVGIPLTGLTGVISIAFYVESGQSDNLLYIDNISIVSCSKPTNLAVNNITSSSANVSWSYSSGSNFLIEYKADAVANWTSLTYATTNYALSNLSPNTNYTFRIKSICGIGDTSVYDSVSFRTLCVSVSLPFTEGFASTTFPPSNCWNCMTGLLPTDGTSVTFTSTSSTKWTIDDFANNTTISKSAKANVYGPATKEWLIMPTINLGTTGDVALEFDLALTDATSVNQAEGIGTDDKFAVLISSNGIWTINDTLALWNNAGSSRVYFNINRAGEHVTIPLTNRTGEVRIAFYVESTAGSNSGPDDCDLFVDNIKVSRHICHPVATVNTITTGTSVKVDWTALAGQTQWKVSALQAGIPVASQIVNTTTYTFNGLQRGAIYTFEVRNICGVNAASIAVASEAVTINPCNDVSNVTIVRACPITAIIGFTAAAGQTQWQLSYKQIPVGDASTKIINKNRDTLTGLTPNTSYEIMIRPVCGTGDTGIYSAPVTLQTGTCIPVENLTIPRIGVSGDTIFASWYNNECHQNWEISVVPEGSPRGTATTTNTYQGVNIKVNNPNSNYDVYVRGYCGNGEYSDWVMATSYATSISASESSLVKITLAPNPARNNTQLSIEGANCEVEMILFTPEGRILKKEQFNCQSVTNKDITLQGLPKGAYLIRLTHKNWTRVEKLVIQ